MSELFLNIKPGLVHYEEKIVGEDDLASKYGSGTAEVFATPALICLMEKASMKCVCDLLPEGFITLGTEVNIRHIKATPVGMKVRCEAKLLEVDEKKLLFEVSVWDEEAQVGIGIHQRYIVEKSRFMERFNKSTEA